MVAAIAAASVACTLVWAFRRRRPTARVVPNASSSASEPLVSVEFWVNGVRHLLVGAERPLPRTTLVDYLRKVGLKGTKVGCGSGACGACTVMLSRRDVASGRIVHESVNACLVPLLFVDGCHITTVEGVGDTVQPSLVQRRLAKFNATQCGFCTPGIVMSLHSALCNGLSTPAQLEGALAGNLCRCTGYRPILDAAKSLSSCCFSTSATCASSCGDAAADIEDFGSIQKWQSSVREQASAGAWKTCTTSDKLRSCKTEGAAAYPAADITVLRASVPATDLVVEGPSDGSLWLRPATLHSLMCMRSKHPTALVVAGETDFTVHLRASTNTFIDISKVPELYVVTVDLAAASPQPLFRLGAAVTVSRAIEALESALVSFSALSLADNSKVARLTALKDALSRLGTPQNRHAMAAVSHLSATDLAPVLLACGAMVFQARDTVGLPISSYFDTPKAERRGAAGMVLFMTLPAVTLPDNVVEFVCALKAAPRRVGAFGTVSAGMRLQLVAHAAESKWIVRDATLAFGGFSSSGSPVVVAKAAQSALVGSSSSFKVELFAKVAEGLRFDLESALKTTVRASIGIHEVAPNVPGALSASLLFRFFIASSEWLEQVVSSSSLSLPPPPSIDDRDRSATTAMNGHGADIFGRSAAPGTGPACSAGAQAWSTVEGGLQTALGGEHFRDSNQNSLPWKSEAGPTGPHAPVNLKRAPVGEPLVHACANQQTTGEAIFAADVEPPYGCLEAAMVMSPHAHARIVSIDTAKALAIPGVRGYFDHKDLASRSIKGKGRVEDDQDRVFADGLVTCVATAIGVIVADTAAIARQAASAVEVVYDVLEPCLSINDAVRMNRFHDYDHCIADGDVETALASAPHRLSGGLCVGAQEHFYMEPHALMAIPGETYGEMEIISCTQCVTKSAKCVAGCLGVPEAKVRCVVKRLGGGFGGKETLSIYRSGAIAVAAAKLKKAVRLVLTREEDMAISGQSHPFDGKWTVGFDDSGKVLACDVMLLNDAGCTSCCSNVVMDRAVAHFANSYHLGAVRVVGRLAWTHLPSNTAFRGFGVPQSALICEDMLEAIAAALCLHPDSVRAVNFLSSGARTHYGQLVEKSHTHRVWKELRSTADVDARRDAIQAFNASHRWRKRGMAVVPTMYGVNFPVKYLNQAGAQVLVYTDGSVYITHAAVEMGQGLNTKVMQVAAQALGVDIADCHIAECSSDRVNNTSPTAASMGADLNGMATLHACEQIRDRLKPIREELGPDKPFRDVCALAYKRQISLAAYGFYCSPFGGVHRWRQTRAGDHLSSADRSPSSNASRGDIFNYFAFGCAAAEVELDVLTGLFEVVRADLLMDVGDSLNTSIDIGQVEGAFVQGMGRWTTEQIRFNSKGEMTTVNPHTYLIPSAADVPRDFRVTLLGDARNPRAVHSSKAVGEPPFFLSSSVYFALKDAVRAAREEAAGAGAEREHVRIDAPLLAHKIRLACNDAVLASSEKRS